MAFLPRVKRVLAEKGLLRTCGWALRSLLGFCGFLIYEPVEVLMPEAPIVSFTAKTERTRIAVQIHMFYPALARELIEYTNQIPYPFDCYISTDTDEKAREISRAFDAYSHAARYEVNCYPNRGRDIAPFLLQMAPHMGEYDYLCHLHSKHSAHDRFGERWRAHLLHSLLASPGHVSAILNRFEKDSGLGLVFQRTYWRLKRFLGWRGNRAASEALMRRMGLSTDLPRFPQFPVGDMFWARTDAIASAFECGLSSEDFPLESGQVEGTTAHCLERCWGCLAQARGYGLLRVNAKPNKGEKLQ